MRFLEEETLHFEKYMNIHDIRLDCVALNYVFFEIEDYLGVDTHKLAAIKGVEKISELLNIQRKKTIEIFAQQENLTSAELLKKWGSKYCPIRYTVIPEAMEAEPVLPDYFFDEYSYEDTNTVPLTDKQDFTPYFFAYIEPPYGNPAGQEDFRKLNKFLFSEPSNLIIYRWNDDWSDYFDDGKEWWGTYFWTVYDSESQRMTVIGGSTTD